MIKDIRDRTRRPFNVNVFCHQPAQPDRSVERAWLDYLRPHFAEFNSEPPAELRQIYTSFLKDDRMLAAVLAKKPHVVSFHFGLPSAEHVRALRAVGIVLLATATNIAEGRAAANAGVHGVVAQGYEAGGHRGIFDPAMADDCLGTVALTRLLVRGLDVAVAAGGIMDGAGIAAALRMGASAAQLGTAFFACLESGADANYGKALVSDTANHTVMTSAISGRPARCLRSRFTLLGQHTSPRQIPAYLIAYDAGKALCAAAKRANETGYGVQWAGQGAPLSRALPAADLVATLAREMAQSA